jgi:hypothetical protein
MSHIDPVTIWAMRWQVPATALDELRALITVAPAPGDDSNDETPERAIVRQCRLVADECGGVLLRNNSGATRDHTGRMIRYGLGNDSAKLNRDYKSPDLVGIAWNGRFVGVECKAAGWKGVKTDREKAQANFGRHVQSLGGLFTFASDPDHVRALFMHARNLGP